MTWYEPLTGQEFREWLLQVGRQARISQGTSLDPFGTSNRHLRRVTEFLRSIEQGEEIEGGERRRQQAPVDLASAGLIERGEDGDHLSEMGRTVLEEWRGLGIADDLPEHEVPRCLVLYRHALQAGSDQYAQMEELWRRLREVASAENLLAAPAFLHAVSYLDQSKNGFNPLRALLGGVETLDAQDLDEAIDWDALGESLPENEEDIEEAIEEISRRIDEWTARGGGRLDFCRAMEANTLPVEEALDFLKEQGLEDNVIVTCREILSGPARGTIRLAEKEREIWTLLDRRKNVILYGPPGTGKTYSALRIARQWEAKYGTDCVFRVTFHPSYDYEDFVEGFRPKEDAPDEYEKQPGVLLEAIKRADRYELQAGDTEARRVLVLIDEINRGDVARIFGELITYIEPDKRGEPVRLAQSPGKSIDIPGNLYFLGTMNTADKSVSMLDIALRRRFAFVELPPDPEFYHQPDWVNEIDGLQISRLLEALNLGLAKIGVEKDRAIGHSTLAVRADEDTPLEQLRDRLEFDVYPLLSEYAYGNRQLLRDVLGNLVDEDGEILPLSELGRAELLERLRDLCDSTLPGDGPGEYEYGEEAAQAAVAAEQEQEVEQEEDEDIDPADD